MTDAGPTHSSKVNGWRVAGWSAAAALLLLPALAGQLTDEVQWTLGDFFVFGGMLAVLGLTLEAIAAFNKSFGLRAALMIGAGLAFLLLWAELAVGILD